MDRRQFITAAAGLLIVLHLGAPAWGQAPPSITTLAGMSSSPTPQQQAALEAFVNYYAPRLASDDPADVVDARTNLYAPLRSVGVTLVFRAAYGDVLVPRLKTVVADTDHPMGSVNAVQIAAALATIDSLEVMIENCSRNNQPRMEIRLWAARGMGHVINTGMALGTINERNMLAGLRELGRAALAEDDWRVLRWQLHAAGSIDHDRARTQHLQMLDGVMDKLEATPTCSPMMLALRPSVTTLREWFIGQSPPQQRQSGPEIGRRLGRLLTIVDKHFTDAQQNRELGRAYHGVVDSSETLLQFVFPIVAGRSLPQTTLAQHFKDADAEQYRSDLASLTEALARPPFGQ